LGFELLAELDALEYELVVPYQAPVAQLVAQPRRKAPGSDAVAGELGDVRIEGLELQVAQVRADVGELGRGIEIDRAADARRSVGLHAAGKADVRRLGGDVAEVGHGSRELAERELGRGGERAV